MLAIVVPFGWGAFPIGASIMGALVGLVGICHAALSPGSQPGPGGFVTGAVTFGARL
jgi:hypothetical protein